MFSTSEPAQNGPTQESFTPDSASMGPSVEFNAALQSGSKLINLWRLLCNIIVFDLCCIGNNSQDSMEDVNQVSMQYSLSFNNNYAAYLSFMCIYCRVTIVEDLQRIRAVLLIMIWRVLLNELG